MSPFGLELEKTATPALTVSLEPAMNAFVSACLLTRHAGEPGIHDWVQRVRSQMSADELARHALVMVGFFYAAEPERSFGSFPAYLDDLERRPPSRFREILLDTYAGIFMGECTPEERQAPVDWQSVLATPAHYVQFLNQRFGEDHIDESVETRAYSYVMDPEAMKQLIVGHLRWFWTNYLQAEWERVRPLLDESVNAFGRLDLLDMPRLEAARLITGQELQSARWSETLERAEKVVFIPNAHIGPYLQRMQLGGTFYVFFGARQPEGAAVRIPELDRAEIVARLSALADDTRLHILSMIAGKAEMRSQEIIDGTGLSQPSVSRYLSQLTAAGFLHERRDGGSKLYAVNFDRIEKTLKAVSAFLLDRA